LILSQNIHKSTKHAGRYEEIIINILINYFKLNGYDVVPHSSLNIAWGSIISDIDILMIKNFQLICIEVKSNRDKIAKAKGQIERIKDYIDFAYVASDKPIDNFELPDVGIIQIQGDEVTILRMATKFTNKPDLFSLASLKKKCIENIFGDNKHLNKSSNKYELALNVYLNDKCSRECLKEIVTCGGSCGISCPILHIAKEELLIEKTKF